VLALGREQNGLSLVGPDAAGWVEPPVAPVDPATVRTGPRVGVSGPGGDGGAHPWRLWLDGEPTVSAYRPGRPRNAGRP
jgi:DNA-3-methyladenine glycosylase